MLVESEGSETGVRPIFIFDIGGVVIKWKGSRYIYDFIAERYNLPRRLVESALYSEIRGLERGEGDSDERVRLALRSLGREMGNDETGTWLLKYPFEQRAKLRVGTVKIIDELKSKGYLLYALSNTCFPHLEVMRERGWVSMFNRFFSSCELRVMKPDAAAYLSVLREIDAPPGRVVFIDDREENVKGARRVGIRWSITFRSVKQLRKEINLVLKDASNVVL
jgi:HAD superfamily hydrolase (TIGR01509 family)